MPDEQQPRPPQPRKPPRAPGGHYELHAHPALEGLVVIWWYPAPGDGQAGPTNMTLDARRVPLMRAAMQQWERRQQPDSQEEVQPDGAERMR